MTRLLAILLLTLVPAWAASSVNPLGGIRINADTTGTNTRSSSVTITNSTDVMARNYTGTNSVKILSLTASRAAAIAADKTVTNALTTLTELNYSQGLIGNIQDQIDALVDSTNTIVLATVPDLVAYAVGANTNIYALIKGRDSANDGGGGFFFYDPGSIATTNLGTIFKPQASGGRWFRLYSGPVNIKWFGADPSGVGDSYDAIQNAIDVANNLYAPAGTYALATPLVSNARLLFLGDGMEETKLRWIGAGSTNAMLVLTNGFIAGSVISGLSLDGNSSINCLLLNAHTEAQIYNCQFYSYLEWAVRLVDAVHANIHENRFRSSPTTNTYAILFDGGSGHTVWGNSFATGAKGIGFVRPSNGLVIGPENRFEPNLVGIEIPTLDFFNSMTLLGNFFESNTPYPILAGTGTNSAFSKLTLIGNTFAVTAQTNYFENISGLTLIGNSFADVYIGTNVTGLNMQNNSYNNPPTIEPTSYFSLDTHGEVALGEDTILTIGPDTQIYRTGVGLVTLSAALGINTTPLSPLHIRWPTVPTGGFQPFLVQSTDSVAQGIGGGIAFGGRYTNDLYSTWAEILGKKASAVAGELGGYILFNPRDSSGVWVTNNVLTQYGLSMGIWPPIPAKLSVYDDTPGLSNFQMANLIASNAVAADIGGTLGLGGHYNGTNIAIWAQLRGLKTNATPGDLAAYASMQVRGSAGTWGEAWRFSTADVAPGSERFYGTDNSGVKGWYSLGSLTNFIASASNLGSGVGVYAGTTDQTNLTFNSLATAQGLGIASNANTITVYGPTMANVGTGVGIYSGATGTGSTNHTYNSLTGANGITVSSNASTLTVALTVTNHTTLALTSPTAAVSVSTNLAFWSPPFASTLKEVRFKLLWPSTSGSVTVDLLKNGTTVLTAPVSMGVGVTNSTATLSVTTISANDVFTGAISGAGTSATNLQAQLLYTTP